MANKTADDRRHEYRLLLTGFVLTTVVGGLLTFTFQWLSDRQKANEADRASSEQISEQRRTDASKVFAEVSELLDTRLYKWRQVAWAVEKALPASQIEEAYTSYRDTLFQWNFRLNKNRALICRFFGPEAGSQFETRIMPKLNALHEHLVQSKNTPPKKAVEPNSISGLADPVNNEIYEFNNRLAESIRSGRIGLTDPANACDFHQDGR
jgi:hypothetical protein